MKAAIVIISGYIQGVGYRKFVKQQARKLHVTGWVQNMPDGSVEAKLFGTVDAIEALIKLCKKGTFLSEVKETQVRWVEEKEIPSEFIVLAS